MSKIAICAIIKNEARYLAEWLEYHRLIGIDRFYIYNNNSSDNIQEVCSVFSDCVTLIDWPLLVDQQRKAYEHYVASYSMDADWTAFIDGDEFIAYKGPDNLRAYLNKHAEKNAILMKWIIFGTSGHRVPPDGLVIENYTMTHSICPNPYWKTICRASHIDAQNISTPHNFDYLTEAPVFHPSDDALSIYHYMLRSEEDVLRKTSRGDAWSQTENLKKQRNPRASAKAYLEKYNNTDLRDEYMFRFSDELRERLQHRGLPAVRSFE